MHPSEFRPDVTSSKASMLRFEVLKMFDDKFNRFDTAHECDRQKEKQTDRTNRYCMQRVTRCIDYVGRINMLGLSAHIT